MDDAQSESDKLNSVLFDENEVSQRSYFGQIKIKVLH
jgi:hypothetical protein